MNDVTLALSQIAGKLGETISVKDSSPEALEALILSKLPRPLSGDALSLAKENREIKIDALVGKKITPAVANTLKLRFASNDCLILSHGDFSDGFEEVMLLLSEMPDLPVNFSDQSGPQVPVNQLQRPRFGKKSKYAEAMESVFSETERK